MALKASSRSDVAIDQHRILDPAARIPDGRAARVEAHLAPIRRMNQHIGSLRAGEVLTSKQPAEELSSFRDRFALLIALCCLEEERVPLAFLLLHRQGVQAEKRPCGMIDLLHLPFSVIDDHAIADRLEGGFQPTHLQYRFLPGFQCTHPRSLALLCQDGDGDADGSEGDEL